jgi:hypothetical protein
MSAKKYFTIEDKRKAKALRMAKWRKDNPEKQKYVVEALRKRYHSLSKEDKLKRNEYQRMFYKKNDVFRESLLKKQAEKYLLRTRPECLCCGGCIPKYSQKYCSDCRCKAYVLRMKEWVESHREHVNKRQNNSRSKQIEGLTDGYIAMILRGTEAGLKLSEIPKAFIDLKREHIKLHRTIKQLL